MSYTRNHWVSGETPLSAQNFNNMEDGIEENKESIASLIDTMGDEWSQSITYEVGNYVIYNNTLWKCLVKNNGQVPAEGTYWTKRRVADEFSELNSNFGKMHLFPFSLNINANTSWGSNFYGTCIIDISSLKLTKAPIAFVTLQGSSASGHAESGPTTNTEVSFSFTRPTSATGVIVNGYLLLFET